MYQIRLNLMPVQKKKRVENLMRFLFAKHLLMVLVLVASISGMLMLFGRYILEKNFINLAASLTAVTKEADKVNKEVRDLNQKIVRVNAVQNGFVPWSKIALDVTGATPAELKWSEWNFGPIGKQNTSLKLTGFADTRDAMLKLAENLRKILWIKNVDIPLDALVKIGQEPFKIELLFNASEL